MKKFLLALLMVIGLSLPAAAQKGMKGIGANIGFGYSFGDDHYNSKGTIVDEEGYEVLLDLKFQYNVSNFYRVQPYIGIGYTSLASPNFSFEIGVDNHIFFWKPSKIRMYAILGIGYSAYPGYEDSEKQDYIFDSSTGQWNYHTIYDSKEKTKSAGIANIGLGLDARLSSKWSLQAEVTPSMLFGDNVFYLSPRVKVGLSYNF